VSTILGRPRSNLPFHLMDVENLSLPGREFGPDSLDPGRPDPSYRDLCRVSKFASSRLFFNCSNPVVFQASFANCPSSPRHYSPCDGSLCFSRLASPFLSRSFSLPAQSRRLNLITTQTVRPCDHLKPRPRGRCLPSRSVSLFFYLTRIQACLSFAYTPSFRFYLRSPRIFRPMGSAPSGSGPLVLAEVAGFMHPLIIGLSARLFMADLTRFGLGDMQYIEY